MKLKRKNGTVEIRKTTLKKKGGNFGNNINGTQKDGREV